MKLSTVIDETKKNSYDVIIRDGKQGIHTKRVNGNLGLAKGLRGRYVQLEIENVDGSDFDLQTVEILFAETTRT